MKGTKITKNAHSFSFFYFQVDILCDLSSCLATLRFQKAFDTTSGKKEGERSNRLKHHNYPAQFPLNRRDFTILHLRERGSSFKQGAPFFSLKAINSDLPFAQMLKYYVANIIWTIFSF